MDRLNDPNPEIMDTLKNRLGDRFKDYVFPPPVFVTMEGEFLEYDLEAGWLKTRFPIARRYLNPYGCMQGGILAAAVDNTIGPLSVLVAPPNVTRRLEMKYNRPATPAMGFLIVTARFVERRERRLFFKAEVADPKGQRLARSNSIHIVLEQ